MFENILHKLTQLITSHKIQIDLYPELATLIPESENRLMFIS